MSNITRKKQSFHHIKKTGKKIELNNKLIALNVLYLPYKTEEIIHAYKSKHNLNQIILLIITDDEKWHFLAVKSFSALFRGITWKHNKDFYCLNCFHIFGTEESLKSMKMYVKIMTIGM